MLFLKWKFWRFLLFILLKMDFMDTQVKDFLLCELKPLMISPAGLVFINRNDYIINLWKRLSPAGMDASQMHLWDVSFSVSETSQREPICKSLRRFPGDWLKKSPQRRLWDLSGFLRDIFELHLRLQFLAFKLRHCLSKAWLPVHLHTSLHIFF